MVLYLQKYWIQLQDPHTAHYSQLNTADGSPMTALGMTVLHLRIAEFKFTHNFVICNRLPDTEIIFNIDTQKKFLFHILRTRKKLLYTKRWQIPHLHMKL